MKASKVKELIKQSLLELESEKKKVSNSGPMTPEEEEMIKRYEEEEANKYALDKEEPLEEADVMKKAREIVAKHKGMMNENEDSEDISSYDRDKIETSKANTLARSIASAIQEVDPELHVDTFAKGVADVLKRDYGTHLFQKFIGALRGNLGSYEDIVTEADRMVEAWKKGKALVESKKAKRSKMLKENKAEYTFDLDRKFVNDKGEPGMGEGDEERVKQILVAGVMNIIKHVADSFGTNTADDLYTYVEKVKAAESLEELGNLYEEIQDFLHINTDVYTSTLGYGEKDMRHHRYGL